MKILVLVPHLSHMGGVTNYYRCLRLDQQENVTYMNVNASAPDSKLRSIWSRQAIAIRKIGYLPIIYIRFMLSAYSRQLIHVNPSLNFKSFFRDMGFIILSRIMRKKILIFFRGWEDSYENKIKSSLLLKFLFRHSYAKADAYIVLGNIFKRKIIDLGVDSRKRIYLETTVADSEYIETLDMDKKIRSFDKEVNLLFISRILTTKGIYIAIDACERCNKILRGQKVTLYVAGDGEELDNVRNYVKQNYYTNIKIIGYAEGDVKRDTLEKCHIMLFPTYGEGLPNCVLEGMLYGMPIISRPVGAIPDVVKHGCNGYLTDSLNSTVYADYCVDLIKNRRIYEEMARLNYRKAKELFVTEAVRARVLEIYQDLGSL